MDNAKDNTNETKGQAVLTKNHAKLTADVKAHIDADAVIAGHYWNEGDNAVGGTGCFIGCLVHSSSADGVESIFGLPVALVILAEGIFGNLPADEGKAFFANIPNAVGRDGKDLSRVHWAFLASELRALPPVPSHIQDVIDPVIVGMDLLAGGGVWDAAHAARAVRAASCATDAADDHASHAARAAAAHAARAVARAHTRAHTRAYTRAAAARAVDAHDHYCVIGDSVAATRRRQAETLLRLIAGAGEVTE